MSWKCFALGVKGFGQVLGTDLYGFLKGDEIEEKIEKGNKRKHKPKLKPKL